MINRHLPGKKVPAIWDIQHPDKDAVRALQQKLECAALLPRLLIARGMGDYAAARDFLTPSLQRDWGAPEAIPGMTEAAAALAQAVRDKRRLAVFGDYDVDGLVSSAIMLLFLRRLGAVVEAVIPHRLDEGYGLTEAALERVYQLEPELVITVDSGITSIEEVRQLKEHGVETIVTDHHEPTGVLPQALAVTDPKLDPQCEFGILAGAGVALKLVQATGALLGQPTSWLEYTDLAALGTIADVMSLRGANRALVQEGLLRLVRSPRPGIEALLRLVSRRAGNGNGSAPATAATSAGPASGATAMPAPLKALDLSFGLIPRLNAAGRMDDAALALDLLLCDNAGVAATLAERLDALNTLRRGTEQELSQAALAQTAEVSDDARVIIAAGENWHDGVRGIAASRLAHSRALPAIVFSLEDGMATGSGRSVGTVNLFKAVESCAPMLTRFGGHAAAVGVSLPADKLEAFTRQMQDYVAALPAEQFLTPLVIDSEADFADFTIQAIEELEMAEPFGKDNPQPHFMLADVGVYRVQRIGAQQNHLSFLARSSNSAARPQTLEAIWFNCPGVDDPLYVALASGEGRFDLAFTPEINEWRGRRSVKLHIRGVRLATGCASQAPAAATASASAAPAPAAATPTIASGTDIQTFAKAFLERTLGPDASLHAAQARSIANLANRRSTLTVMATGRGKSLIFQIAAAWLACEQQRGTIIVFPLRALLNDQYFHLSESLSSLGLKVERLSGQTPGPERGRILNAYRSGEVSVLLTTPEYLAFNRRQFVQGDRTGLLVFDEAHHIATSGSAHRPVYARAGELRALFPEATVLALSATAGDAHAQRICAELGIAALVRDATTRPNLKLFDARGQRERVAYLAERLSDGVRSLIYVNARASAIELCKSLRRELPDFADKIVFYHAGMERADRLRIEQAYRQRQASTIVATSAFGEGVNIPDVRDVFLFHLPFAAVDLNQMSGRAGRDGQDSGVHLLYGADDVAINRAILEAALEDAQDEEAKAEAQAILNIFENFQLWALEAKAQRIEQMIRGPILPGRRMNDESANGTKR
ncbi:MAG: DEAD/DEAH box helicase [Coriobacteriales bacterium]|jgi:single-stranded-DNA-specific exonuclease|nr:DEAD/DEAH box helicase [Coriobacteriales bacterium]